MAAYRPLLRIGLAALGAGSILTSCATSKSSSGGASSPQNAVSKLLDDITAKRYADVPGDLAPGEKAALAEPLGAMFAQLDRLGILSAGTSLSNLPGFSVTFTNPTYSVSSISTGVDFVKFTGGTVTASADPSQLPIGPTIRSLIKHLPSRTSHTTPLAGSSGAGLAALQVNGGWYVSLNYTAAEGVRQSSHLAAPDPAQSVKPAGDSSANAAVTDFLKSALTLDLKHLLALTPPDELPAVRAYASLFLPKAQAATARLSGFSASLGPVTYADQTQPDRTLVTVKTVTVNGHVNGTSFTYQNGCASVMGVQVCRNNLGELMTAGHAPQAAGDLVDLFAKLRPQLGFVAVKENGRWFVSPTRTLLDDSTAILAAVSQAQLNRFVTDVKTLQNHG